MTRLTLDMDGLLILLTGAAGAIGVVVVDRLVAQGAHVVAVDVVAEDVAAGVLPRNGCTYLRADASDEAAVTAVFDAVVASTGRLPDAVCCHAGVVASHPVERYPLEELDELFRVNVRAAFVTAREAASRWRDAGEAGHLVFTSSWVQDVPWPGIAPYSASKAALRSLARSFARELAPYGIRSNALAPGIVGVGMAKRQWDEDPEYRSRAARAVPLGRLQTAESVADAFVLLLSPLAAYATGSVFLVDGGCSLYPMD